MLNVAFTNMVLLLIYCSIHDFMVGDNSFYLSLVVFSMLAKDGTVFPNRTLIVTIQDKTAALAEPAVNSEYLCYLHLQQLSVVFYRVLSMYMMALILMIA